MGAAAAQAKNHLATVLNLSRVASLSEQRRNQRLGSPKPFVGEDHRLRFVDRVPNQALAMEPVERVPVEALPRSLPVMERQAEQRQDGIVDLVLIDLHAPNAMPPWSPMSTLFAAAPGEGLHQKGVGEPI
jgi:hypothetical protein